MLRAWGRWGGVSIAVLAAATLAAVDADPRRAAPGAPEATARRAPLSPALRRMLEERDGPFRVWVFLADKGHVSASARDAAVAEVAAGYAPRAVQRRQLRGSAAREGRPLFDERDLPVHEAYVREIEATGARVRIRSRWLNAVSAVASREQLDAIARLPSVAKLQPVARAAPPEPIDLGPAETPPPRATLGGLDYGRSTTQLAQIDLIALHEAGYTGAGVIVGVLDTGFRRDHVSFQQPGHEIVVLGEYDFVDDDGNAANEPGDPSSQHNHGTLILGTLGAYHPGELVGGAYDASFVLCKTEDTTGEYQGEEDNYVAGLEFAESHGADLTTSSLGYIDWYTQADLDGETAVTTIAVNVAGDLGVHTVTAAGNAGHDSSPATSTLIAPADAFRVITAGAVTSSGSTASFSSSGPTADGRVKPEVLAMGSGTQTVSPSSTTTFTSASGTSLSTPLVAAAVACLVQAHPTWTVETMREALFESADFDPGGFGFDPLHIRGYGILDALGTHVNASGLTVGPSEGFVSEGLAGGPFSPAARTYTLGNNDGTPIDWAILGSPPWLDVVPDAGTLPGGGTVEVELAPNAAAAALPDGRHEATLDFVNLTDHEGDTTREVVLHVGRTIIRVDPDAEFATGGGIAGPFSGSTVYTVTSERPTPVEVQVTADPPWIAVGAPSFTLSGTGAAREVEIGVSALAGVLGPGTYTGSVAFTNATSGEGSTTRTIELTVGGPQPVWVVSLDEDPGWGTTGDWAFGAPTGGGTHAGDPVAGHSGANVYGYNLAGDYSNDMAEETLTSAPFDCSGLTGVEVAFRRWLGVERSVWDHARFEVSTDGTSWSTIWGNDAAAAIDDGAWVPVAYDVSAIADGQPALQLRWVMGTTDSSVTYPGWNVDDVEVRGIVPSDRVALLLDEALATWTPVPGSTGYDVIAGDLALLRSSGGDFAAATAGCLGDDVAGNTLSVVTAPGPGEGIWLLVRRLTASGPETFDSLGPGQSGPRDGEIAASGSACP